MTKKEIVSCILFGTIIIGLMIISLYDPFALMFILILSDMFIMLISMNLFCRRANWNNLGFKAKMVKLGCFILFLTVAVVAIGNICITLIGDFVINTILGI